MELAELDEAISLNPLDAMAWFSRGELHRLAQRYPQALTDLDEAIRLGLDLGDAQVLKKYEEWRALDALMVMGATDSLTRIFGVPGKSASAVRRLGMAGIQRSGWLKRFFMDEARGISGKLPELLKA